MQAKAAWLDPDHGRGTSRGRACRGLRRAENSARLVRDHLPGPRLPPLPVFSACAPAPSARSARLDLNGDRQQETTFVDVTAWNQQAEVISAYCQKGRPVAVEGRLEQERWETPTGEKRSRLKVVAQRVTFLPGNGGTAPEAEPLP